MPLDLAALLQLPKLHDAHDLWPKFLRSLGSEDRDEHGLRLSQTALTIDAALSGQGVALVSRFLVTRDIAVGNLVQVTPETLRGQQDFYLLVERRAKRDAATGAVVDWLSSKAVPEG